MQFQPLHSPPPRSHDRYLAAWQLAMVTRWLFATFPQAKLMENTNDTRLLLLRAFPSSVFFVGDHSHTLTKESHIRYCFPIRPLASTTEWVEKDKKKKWHFNRNEWKEFYLRTATGTFSSKVTVIVTHTSSILLLSACLTCSVPASYCNSHCPIYENK